MTKRDEQLEEAFVRGIEKAAQNGEAEVIMDREQTTGEGLGQLAGMIGGSLLGGAGGRHLMKRLGKSNFSNTGFLLGSVPGGLAGGLGVQAYNDDSRTYRGDNLREALQQAVERGREEFKPTEGYSRRGAEIASRRLEDALQKLRERDAEQLISPDGG